MASDPAAAAAAAAAAVEQRQHSNPLVSTSGSSEIQAILHPLVLLSISDYVARHALRGQQGPVVGGLLGQQNGREITIEHAFDVYLARSETSGEYAVDWTKFHKRLEQMRLVHKDRQLDFVGWYTLLPSTGPDESILGIHRFFLDTYNQSAILLGFHPDEVQKQSGSGGKLPLTIYESNLEVDGGGSGRPAESEDKKMDDGEGSRMQLRFRELAYSVETEETEMISMNYVAAGSSSATTAAAAREDRPSRSIESDGKGKRRLVESEADAEADAAAAVAQGNALSRDEEEMISTLTTKANAIRMLQSRIDLITAYLERLPPSSSTDEDDAMDGERTVPSLPILRQIQALVSRLDLVIPSDREAFDREMLQEANDVHLIELLNTIMQSTDQARDVGKKYAIIDQSRNGRRGPVSDPSMQAALASMSNAGDIMMK